MVGPTASGKSGLALRLARETGACLLSADSMQVYRGMDIGTAKPSPRERADVPHHMIDLVDPREVFSVADFQRLGRDVLSDHASRPVIVVGGSGLHVRALLDPMTFAPHDAEVRESVNSLDPQEARLRLVAADPGVADLVDLANPRRVERALEILELTGITPSQRAATPEAQALRAYVSHVPFDGLGVDPGDQLADRVATRLQAMMAAGFVEEVRQLQGRLGPTATTATGYPETASYLAGELEMDQAVERIGLATMSLAKRQRTFFRRDPRIHWLVWSQDPDERYGAFRAEVDRLGTWNS